MACALLVIIQGLVFGGQGPRKVSWPVQAKVAGYNVYAFGPFDVYSVSPTYFPNLALQEGNRRPRQKLLPKKSWEIRSNYIGLTGTRLPSSTAPEIEPRNPVFFIDEDASTIGFAGRPEGDPSTARAFVRILLPLVTPIQSVVLLPAPGKEVPRIFSVVIHRWERWEREQPEERGQWETVYEERGERPLEQKQPENTAPNAYQPEDRRTEATRAEGKARRCQFPAQVPARDVWITSPDDFELGEIRVLDALGRNVASLSAGGTVTVSRRSYLFWFDEDTQRHMWPMAYDLGLKWLRVNYYLTPLIWPYVERQRGVYTIDPYTEQVLREAVQKGVTVALTLGPPVNSLYAEASPEVQIKAFCEYVRFMVRRFKPFVHYFEILNEYYNQDAYGPGKTGPFERTAREYAAIALPAAKVIREEAADAKIILCGPCPLAVDWIDAALKTGLAPLVDVIAWHPYQLTDPPEILDRPRHPWAGPQLTRYDEAVRYLRDLAQRRGFRGTLQANEAGAYAIHQLRSTALVSAKYLARSLVLHSALRIPVFWNETVSLFRPAWQPFFWPGQGAVQPDYSYYVLRTVSTLMDGMEPVTKGLDLELSGVGADAEMERHLFRDRGGRLLLALWRPLYSKNDMEAVSVDVALRGFSARRAAGFELFNGEEQELELRQQETVARLKGLQVRDYPLFVRLDPEFRAKAPAAKGGGD